MDPEERAAAANEASAAMGPLAQVVAAYYHGLTERSVPERTAEKLARDFQFFYLTEDVGEDE